MAMGSKRSVLTWLAQSAQTQETRCKSAMCADWLAVHHTTVLLPDALACAPTADSGRCLLTSSSGYFILHHCILTVRPKDNPPSAGSGAEGVQCRLSCAGNGYAVLCCSYRDELASTCSPVTRPRAALRETRCRALAWLQEKTRND